MLQGRRRPVGKDEGKTKFPLESVPCGGNLNPEQHLKALGVHRNGPQTFRREMGEFHKNYPESLDFKLNITSGYSFFARHVLLSRRATFSCPSPLLRAHSNLRAHPGPLPLCPHWTPTGCQCWLHSSSLPVRVPHLRPFWLNVPRAALVFIYLGISCSTSCFVAFFFFS